MLYKDFKEYENIDPENKVEFLFDAIAYNEYINVADVAALEEFHRINLNISFHCKEYHF